MSLLAQKIKGGDNQLVRLSALIQDPQSEIAQPFQKEIKAKYKLYESKRKPIKKKRHKRKMQ